MKCNPLLVVFLIATISFAQIPDTLLSHKDEPPLKSAKSAVLWSVGTTIGLTGLGALMAWKVEPAIGWSTIAGGILVGPSVGHFYAGQWGRGFMTVGLRSGIAAVGFFLTYAAAMAYTMGNQEVNPGLPLYIASATVVAQGIHDITTTPESVRKYNDRLQLKPELNLREKRYRLGLVYRF